MYPVEGNLGLHCSILIYKWLYNDFIEYFNWFIIEKEREKKNVLEPRASDYDERAKRHREARLSLRTNLYIKCAGFDLILIMMKLKRCGFFLVSFCLLLLLHCRRETLVDPPSIDTHKWMVEILKYNQPISKSNDIAVHILYKAVRIRLFFPLENWAKKKHKQNKIRALRINVKGHWSDTQTLNRFQLKL